MPSPRTSPSNPLRRKVVQGGAVMLFRHGFVQLSGLVGTIALSRLLSPDDFGVFGILHFAVIFLAGLGEAGLGASLIRQEASLGIEDLRLVFLFQIGISLMIVSLVFLSAPYIVAFFRLSNSQIFLLRTLSLCLPIASLKTIPSIILEKKLDFKRLAVVDMIETVVYFSSAVPAAMLGYGAWSFVIAFLARGIAGAVVCNALSPWPMGVCWNRPRLKSLLAFGIPYQGISLVSMLKDSIIPIVVGRLSGAPAVGYVNWAQSYATYPHQFMPVVNRVLFPAFSQMQGDPAGFAKALGRVIRLNMVFSFALISVMILLSSEIVAIVYTGKWLPALPLVYLLFFSGLFVPWVNPILTALNALGASSAGFRFALLWFWLTWLFGVPMIFWWGFIGFGIANLLVQFSNILVYVKIRQYIPLKLGWGNIAPVVAFVSTLLLGWMCRDFLRAGSGIDLIVSAMVVFLMYSFMILIFLKDAIVKDIRDIWRSLVEKC